MNQDKINIDGVDYIRFDLIPKAPPNGDRYVVVVDRGWIFAGDLKEEKNRIFLSRAVHVVSWSDIEFGELLENPKSPNFFLVPMHHDVDLPLESEIFRIPVNDDWGL